MRSRMVFMPFSTRITRRSLRLVLATTPKPPASVCPVFNPSAMPLCTRGFRFPCSILLYLNVFSLKKW